MRSNIGLPTEKDVCPRNHPLERVRGNGQSDFICSVCIQGRISHQPYFYRCSQESCNFDICKACLHTRRGEITNYQKFNFHKSCMMTRKVNRSDFWSCDGNSPNCPLKNATQQTGIGSWRCRPCEIDLCIDCCLHSGTYVPGSIKSPFGQHYRMMGRFGMASQHFPNRALKEDGTVSCGE